MSDRGERIAEDEPDVTRRRRLLTFAPYIGMAAAVIFGFWIVNDLIDDNKTLIKRLDETVEQTQDGFLKGCERDNIDDSEFADAFHEVFDSGANTPRELEELAIFDDALSPKDCRQLILGEEGAPAPIEVTNQPIPVTTRVDGVEGPAVQVGGLFASRPRFCVRVENGVLMNAIVNWIEIDDNRAPIRLVPGLELDFPLEQGCFTFPSVIPVQEGVTPGRWILSARLKVPNNIEDRVPSFVVVTEPFEVVP